MKTPRIMAVKAVAIPKMMVLMVVRDLFKSATQLVVTLHLAVKVLKSRLFIIESFSSAPTTIVLLI